MMALAKLSIVMSVELAMRGRELGELTVRAAEVRPFILRFEELSCPHLIGALVMRVHTTGEDLGKSMVTEAENSNDQCVGLAVHCFTRDALFVAAWRFRDGGMRDVRNEVTAAERVRKKAGET